MYFFPKNGRQESSDSEWGVSAFIFDSEIWEEWRKENEEVRYMEL
jgi:hypothetical protein